MLDSLRTHAKGWLGKFIVIAISLTFALFGLQSYTASSESEKPLATVGDKNIYQSELNFAYQQHLNKLQEQYGEQFTPEMFNEQALRQNALNRLIQEKLVLNTIEDQGYQASESAVLREIAKIQAFQKDGKFDKGTYTRLLNAQGMSSEGFVQKIKQGLERDQFIQGIVNTTLVDEYQVKNFYKLNMQTRDIRFLLLPLSGVIDTVKVEQTAVEDFYNQNEYRFKTDEKVAIDYIELKLADLIKEVQLSDEELIAFYETEKDSFSSAGKRRASHIMFEAASDATKVVLEAKRKQAELVLARLEAGEDFAELALTLSEDVGSAIEGGDLGNISSGMMDGAFEKALEELKEGEVSRVVSTPFGFHIIKLTELSPATIQPYETVKKRVEKAYREEIAAEKFYQIAEQVNELAFEMPDSLDGLVDQLNLEVKTITSITRAAGEDIANNKVIRDAAFNEDVLAGNNSEVIEISPEHLVVLHLNEYQADTVKPLDDVREMVELAVKTTQARQLLKEKSDELLVSLGSGTKFTAVSTKAGFDITDVGPITRNDNSAPAAILQDAFAMGQPLEGENKYKVSLLPNGDVAVIELTKVVDGDTTDIPKAEYESIVQFLERLQSEVLLTDTLATLGSEAGVKITGELAQ